MRITGPLVRGYASGIGNFEKSPFVYTTSFKCTVDSFPPFPGLRGQCSMEGTFHGLGSSFFLDGMLGGSSLSYAQIPFGSPQIRISCSQPQRLSFTTAQSASQYLAIAGHIDSMTSSDASITAVASLGKNTMKALISRVSAQAANAVDSAWCTVTARFGDYCFFRQRPDRAEHPGRQVLARCPRRHRISTGQRKKRQIGSLAVRAARSCRFRQSFSRPRPGLVLQ